MNESTAGLVDTLARHLGDAGLDLVAPFPFVPATDAEVLPPSSAAGFRHATALAVVIASSRALHPPFFATLAREPALHAEAHPLDRYVERHVERAVRASLSAHPSVATEIRYAHAADPTYVPIQRLAKRAGLVTLGASGLGIHPVYGPWISLRAVVAIDVAGPPPVTELSPPCVCDEHCLPHRRALEARMAVPDASDLSSLYDELVAMREACPVGREHRYDDDALRYHTTKDRAALDRAVVRFTRVR